MVDLGMNEVSDCWIVESDLYGGKFYLGAWLVLLWI